MDDSIKTLVIASNNQGKINEFKALLGDKFNVVPLSETGFEGDIEETGTTFLENALIKAKTVYEATGMYSLSDDSGLCVEELFDAPGVYSARYSGLNASNASNNELLLKNMTGMTNRKAKFVACIVLYFGDDNYIYGMGQTKGVILHEAQGENGFGYDPLFFSGELNESFGTASAERKNSISHRARALADLLEKLEEL